jgi:hypothetical protein
MAERIDYRTLEAAEYRKLYKTARWALRRKRQLYQQPLCERCSRRGRVVVATVAHHRIEHKGNPDLFFGGELESLCKLCHDGEAQQQERKGYATTIGSDGWPIDPMHPANR